MVVLKYSKNRLHSFGLIMKNIRKKSENNLKVFQNFWLMKEILIFIPLATCLTTAILFLRYKKYVGQVNK